MFFFLNKIHFHQSPKKKTKSSKIKYVIMYILSILKYIYTNCVLKYKLDQNLKLNHNDKNIPKD